MRYMIFVSIVILGYLCWIPVLSYSIRKSAILHHIQKQISNKVSNTFIYMFVMYATVLLVLVADIERYYIVDGIIVSLLMSFIISIGIRDNKDI